MFSSSGRRGKDGSGRAGEGRSASRGPRGGATPGRAAAPGTASLRCAAFERLARSSIAMRRGRVWGARASLLERVAEILSAGRVLQEIGAQPLQRPADRPRVRPGCNPMAVGARARRVTGLVIELRGRDGRLRGYD